MKPIGKEVAEINANKAADEKSAVKLDLSKVKVEPLFEEFVDFDTFSKSDFRVVKVKNCEEVPKSNKLLKFTLDDGTEEERTILSGIKNFYSAEELVGKNSCSNNKSSTKKDDGNRILRYASISSVRL